MGCKKGRVRVETPRAWPVDTIAGICEILCLSTVNGKPDLECGQLDLICAGTFQWCENSKIKAFARLLGASNDMPSVPSFQEPVLLYFCMLHWNCSVSSKVGQLPCTICYEMWQSSMDNRVWTRC